MHTNSFIEKLLTRLKSGDARSIHLNALPGNFARLDIYDFINIEQSLHLQFLENLLSKKEFKFSITIDTAQLYAKNNEDKKIIQQIIKRLNHLDYQDKEEFAEHGYHSFGFGFPLLIKRDTANPERIIKAPLLIWYLDIEKDTRKNNTWNISRNENHPLVFNELLKSHFESIEHIKTDELELLVDDDFITERQLNYFCKELLEKLNLSFDAENNIVTILPCTNAETIDSITQSDAWIRWSGVFGLYKMQKQSIIKDLELLLENNDAVLQNDNNETAYFEGETLTPIPLDPSQENVLQQLKENHKIIIQGPPGTGKSQSLTAIILQALLNKKKVLVVCEKRTAMEVLYNNLKKENLHHLSVLIDDVYTDRRKIVENVRTIIERQEQTPERFRTHEYELIHSKFLSLQEEINYRINFCNTEVFGDDNWTELLSKSYTLNQNKKNLERANAIHKIIRNSDYQFSYEEYLLLLEKIKIAFELFSKINKEAFVFDTINERLFSKYTQVDAFIHELTTVANTGTNLYKKRIVNNINQYGEKYDNQKGFTAFNVSFLALFSGKHKTIVAEKKSTRTELTHFITLLQQSFLPIYDLSPNDIQENISNALPKLEPIHKYLNQYIEQLPNLSNYFDFRQFLIQQELNVQNIILALSKISENDWQEIFTTYYLNQTVLKIALDNGIKDDAQQLYETLYQSDALLKQKLCEKINVQWKTIIHEMLAIKDLSEIKYLYNQRKNKQFSSKNSLRKIIHQDFDFFSTLFPVVMVNPTVCTSILPLQENLFDFIILDEASQLRLEDTYSSLLRGKIKIISGDKHQMPPSNFFGNDVIFWSEEDESNTDDFLAESKSLLEYADDANFKSSYLDYHYRSLHPDLIQFSNYAFYQSRLIPLPEHKPYQAIHYNNVDGVYANGTNPIEADKIIEFIFKIEPIEDNFPSIGVATFNIFQRNLIMDKLYEVAYADNEKGEKLQHLLNAGLFVKNLENIQGDERDIMILSTTFGKDKEGKFRQAFGPLTQEKGYQLLNVIITRAKYALHIFTSVPEQIFLQFEEELMQKGNAGKSIFYAYLAYTKACSEKNNSQYNFIKNTLQKNNQQRLTQKNQAKHQALKQQVYEVLKQSFGDSIKQDYTFGGFKLDIVLFKNEQPFLYIDFEQTNSYHPEVVYRIKLHQQKITASYNINVYHLWSYNWWSNASQEIQNITDLLNFQH